METAERTNVEKTVNSRKVRLVLGLDLHSWEQAMLVSLGLVGFFGVAVAFTTVAVVISQRRETAAAKDELEKYKLLVDGKVADAKKEGIEAGKIAGDAVVRAAEANARAAEAELALERFRSPRSLSAEQRARMTAFLAPFAGTPFDIGIPQSDQEAADLQIALEDVLVSAGWRQIDWEGGDIVMSRQGKPTTGIVGATNVAIAAYREKLSEFGVAGGALVAALNENGIVAIGGAAGDDFANKNVNAIHILIGRKN